MAEKCKN